MFQRLTDRAHHMCQHRDPGESSLSVVSLQIIFYMKKDDADSENMLDAVFAEGKEKMRAFLMEKNKEDRFRIMREDLSARNIEEICEWAIPEEDYEICATVEEVKADNIDSFPLVFSFEGSQENQASVVKFLKSDGIFYYHADIVLADGEESSVVRLYKLPDGTWNSEWIANDARFFQPLGEAINRYESQKKVTI